MLKNEENQETWRKVKNMKKNEENEETLRKVKKMKKHKEKWRKWRKVKKNDYKIKMSIHMPSETLDSHPDGTWKEILVL